MIQIKHEKLNEIAIEHFTAVEEQLKRSRKHDKIDNWFRTNGLRLSLRQIILADVNTLDQAKASYVAATYPKYIVYLRNLYNNKFSKSRESIGNNNYNAVTLIENLGIKVCPYCNRNYINNVKLKNGIKRRTCQLDHFYNKDQYPFLALSFYNLIPSCPSCNHIKSTKDISLSPYDVRYDFDKSIIFSYKIKSANFLNDENELEVELTHGKEVEKNVTELGLKDLYKTHNDVVYEIIKKAQIYNEDKLTATLKDFDGLFKGREELNRVIFGNYLSKDAVHKRPLAKLSRDICKKLKLKV